MVSSVKLRDLHLRSLFFEAFCYLGGRGNPAGWSRAYVRSIFSTLLATIYEKISTPPLEKILGAPLHGSLIYMMHWKIPERHIFNIVYMQTMQTPTLEPSPLDKQSSCPVRLPLTGCRLCRYMGVPQITQPPKTLASRIASVPHPIITVTQHTPSPTPTPSVSEEAPGGVRPFLRDLSRRPGTLNRSYSDSDVSYSAEELTEAAGSTYYINKHGGIDLVMLLKVTNMSCYASCTRTKCWNQVMPVRWSLLGWGKRTI